MARDIRMTQNQNSTLKQQASNISTVKNLATKMWTVSYTHLTLPTNREV